MCVEDSNFSLVCPVDQDEDKALRKEETLVDILALADIKAIKLKRRLFNSLVHRVLVAVDSQLHCLSPGDRYCRIGLVSESWSQCKAPIEVWHSTWIDVRRPPNACQRQGPWTNLGNIDFL